MSPLSWADVQKPKKNKKKGKKATEVCSEEVTLRPELLPRPPEDVGVAPSELLQGGWFEKDTAEP